MRLEAERVEIGVKMAAGAVGADQHQRVDGIARRLLHMGGGELDAARLRPRLDLVADRLFDLAPVAIEGGNKFAAGPLRPVRPFPGGAVGTVQHIGVLVLQATKERLPLLVDGFWIGFVAGVEVFDIGGVAAVEE